MLNDENLSSSWLARLLELRGILFDCLRLSNPYVVIGRAANRPGLRFFESQILKKKFEVMPI